MSRKIIQLVAVGVNMTVLDDSGTVWVWVYPSGEWKAMPDLPNDLDGRVDK